MSSRHDLPGGGWVDLRDPEAVTERQRRPLMAAMGAVAATGEAVTAEAMAAVSAINDALILALVEAWSLPGRSLPGPTADALLDLPAKQFDALVALCQPLLTAVLPDFSPTPDTGSPTAPSAA